MPLSCLLAAVMAMNGPPAVAQLSSQDAAAAQGSAPAPAETAQTDASKTEPPAEAHKAPDETTKTGEDRKTQETNPAAGKKTGGANDRRGKRGRHNKDAKGLTEGEPQKVVVRHGGAREPTAQIAPNLSREEAIKLRQNSEGLLGSAEVSLRVLGTRALQPTQQDTVTQIRDYMDRARSALKEGDIVRAHTLALKASLLADDLVKR